MILFSKTRFFFPFFPCRKENTHSYLKVPLELLEFGVVSGKWKEDNFTNGHKVVIKTKNNSQKTYII